MSGDTSEEKSEVATQKKLRKERERGQAPTATDAVVAAAVAGTLLFICASFGTYVERVTSFFNEVMYYLGTRNDADYARVIGLFIDLMIRSFLSVMIISALIATFCTVSVQGGFLLSFESIQPDFQRVNPIEGFLRIFKKRALLSLLFSIVRMLIWTSFSLLVFAFVAPGVINMINISLDVSIILAFRFILLLIVCGIIYLVLVMASDIMVQKFLFADEMKMTKSELKQERKESFGDPTLRSARKSEMDSSAQSVVGIANSTFLARGKNGLVGVYYVHNETIAPIMTVRIKPDQAFASLSLAQRHKIPVVEGEDLVNILQRGIGAGDALSDAAAVDPFVAAFGRFAQGEHL